MAKKKKKKHGSSEIMCLKFQGKSSGKLYSHAKLIIIQECQLSYFPKKKKKSCFLLTVVYFCGEDTKDILE